MKLLVVLLALAGAYLIMSLFFHAAAVSGFHLGGHFIPYWVPVLIVVGYIALKSK